MTLSLQFVGIADLEHILANHIFKNKYLNFGKCKSMINEESDFYAGTWIRTAKFFPFSSTELKTD